MFLQNLVFSCYHVRSPSVVLFGFFNWFQINIVPLIEKWHKSKIAIFEKLFMMNPRSRYFYVEKLNNGSFTFLSLHILSFYFLPRSQYYFIEKTSYSNSVAFVQKGKCALISFVYYKRSYFKMWHFS